MSPKRIIGMLAENEFSVMIFDRRGKIVSLSDLGRRPVPEDVIRLKERTRGKAFRFVERGLYTEADLHRFSAKALEGFELAEKGLLKPGANPVQSDPD